MSSPFASLTLAGINPAAITDAIHAAIPGSEVIAVEPMSAEASEASEHTLVGYGEPLLIRVRVSNGTTKELVFHSASSGPLSQQHRADRASSLLLSYDTFWQVPRHAHAVDVGAVRADGSGLVSLKGTGEFYLLTEFVPGYVYADELRGIAQRGDLLAKDVERTVELALYLAELHARQSNHELYRRGIRDLIAGTDGIFGTIDAYPADAPGVPRMVLERMERLCQPWRWKLRDYEHRGARIHGDFHPFNIVFSDTGLRLMEARRGAFGEPADDVLCLAINYVIFALLWPGTWRSCFRRLWNTFWNTYLAETGDHELLEVAPPFLLWRTLALANPLWYPATPAPLRERLLALAEQTITAPRFDPNVVETLFRDEEPRSSR
jgi:hypothetical protein